MPKPQTQAAEDFLAGGASNPQPSLTSGPASAEDFLAQGAPAGFNASTPTDEPAQNNSGWRVPALIGKAIGAGVEGLVSAPGNLAHMILGRNPSVVESSVLGIPPNSQDLSPVTNALGITGTPQFTPSTPGEKYLAAGASGLGTGAAMLMAAPAAPLTTLLSAVAGNEAGEGTHQMMPSNRWAPVVSGVLAGMGVGGVVGKVAAWSGARKAAQALDEAHTRLETARDSQFYGGEEARIKAAGIKDASKAALDAKSELIDSVVTGAHDSAKGVFDQTAAQLGSSVTLQQAGHSLQDHARNWLSTVLPKKLSDAWGPVNKSIAPDESTPLFGFANALKEINSSAGGLEPVAALLKPNAPAKIQSVLDSIADSPVGKNPVPAKLGNSSILDASGRPIQTEIAPAQPAQPFTWEEVQKLRSTLGDAMHNPQVIKDVGQQNLSKLYATLTGDMRSVAVDRGAGALFDAANGESTRLYQIAEGPISKLVSGVKASAEDPNPENVASSLLAGGKKGASDLQTLRAEIPGGVDELAAAHLRQGPEAWGKLAPETHVALVPDTSRAANLSASLQSKLAAETNAKAELLAAKRDHAETTGAVDEDLRRGNFSRTEQVRLAQKAVAEAKAGIPPSPSPITNLAHKLGNATGAAFGYEFAPTVLSHLGIAQNPMALASVSAAGLALPMLGRSLKNTLRQPLPAVAGGVGGGNALALPGANRQ